MSATEGRITLTAVGDVMLGDSSHFLGRGVGSRIRRAGADAPLAEVAPWIRTRDLLIANLESPLSADPGASSWDRVYRGAAESAQALALASRNVATLANNHILEHGPEVLAETREILRIAGIDAPGFSPEGDDRHAELIWDQNGLRVQLLADSLIPEFSGRPVDPAAREAWLLARLADGRADVRIVTLHWGDEYVPTPSPAQVRLGRALVDAGATLVLGHHPHALQPVEVRGGSLIAYSLGNFLFDQDWTPRTRLGGMLEAEVTRAGVESWSFRATVCGAEGKVAPARAHQEQEARRVITDGTRLDGDAYRTLLARESRRHRISMKAELLRHPWRVSLDTLHFLATKRRRPRPGWRREGGEGAA